MPQMVTGGSGAPLPQCVRRQFAKQPTIVGGKLAQVPETKMRGHIADAGAARVRALQFAPGRIERESALVGFWRQTGVLLKAILQRARARAELFAQLVHAHAALTMGLQVVTHPLLGAPRVLAGHAVFAAAFAVAEQLHQV